METDEKLGTIIVDGKIVNLDSAPVEELEKIEVKLKASIEDIQSKIMECLMSTDE